MSIHDRWRWPYPKPPRPNGCAVHALNILARGDAATSELVWSEARRRGILTASGIAPAFRRALPEWLDIVGLKIVETHRPKLQAKLTWRRGSPFDDVGDIPTRTVRGETVSQFIRSHPTGRWLVDVRGHVFAVVDGKGLGYYNTRQLVWGAYRVEDA